GSGAVGDERAVDAEFDVAGPGTVSGGDRVRDAGAAGLGEEPCAEADEAAGGDLELHAHPAGSVVGHGRHHTLAGGAQLGDGAEVVPRNVDGELLERLRPRAVDRPGHGLRLAAGESESLTTHLLDEDGQRQLSASLDLPGGGTLGRDDLERDVA